MPSKNSKSVARQNDMRPQSQIFIAIPRGAFDSRQILTPAASKLSDSRARRIFGVLEKRSPNKSISPVPCWPRCRVDSDKFEIHTSDGTCCTPTHACDSSRGATHCRRHLRPESAGRGRFAFRRGPTRADPPLATWARRAQQHFTPLGTVLSCLFPPIKLQLLRCAFVSGIIPLT